MAIQRDPYTGATDGRVNATWLYNWLSENASDLFDIDTTNGKCSINGNNILNLAYFNDYVYRPQMVVQGTTSEMSSMSNSNRRCMVAYKTSKGIALFGRSQNSAEYDDWLYIFRTNLGAIGGCHYRYIYDNTGTSNPTMKIDFVDFERNSNFYDPYGSVTTSGLFVSMLTKSASLTSLTSIPLGNGETYADGLYITTFTQMYGTMCNRIIELDGKQYIYNGVFAFEE